MPFKKELYTFVKVFWIPDKKIYQHLHFKGNLKIKVDHQKSFKIRHYGFQIENEIFWEGLTNGWEKESLKLWFALCSQAEVILDIGANTGVYSLIAKAVNPKSKVYAFEPVSRVYKKLLENITLNNFDIVACEKAISNSNGEALIYDTNAEHVYSVTVNKNLSSPATSVSETAIQTITLDSFVSDNKINRIDLIKIDVETHEPEVLQGFSTYLKIFQPTLLIEILTDEVGQRVQELVKELGYWYFNIDERGSIRRVETIGASDYYNFLLCSEVTVRKLKLTR